MLHNVNWGKVAATTQALLCLISSIGYLWNGNWKHSLYWALCCGISVTVTYLL